jgi:transposase
VSPREDVHHGRQGSKPRRPRRAFTPEFKAEILEVCRRGDRSIGQVAKGFDLTETAVRDLVRQADIDDGARADGPTTAEQEELAGCGARTAGCGRMWRSSSGPRLLRKGDPVNVYPFTETEKVQRHNVTRACQLLEVSRSPTTTTAPAPPSVPVGTPS